MVVVVHLQDGLQLDRFFEAICHCESHGSGMKQSHDIIAKRFDVVTQGIASFTPLERDDLAMTFHLELLTS